MAMLMPASIPYYIPIIGAFVAIVVAKWPFGGFGRNPFNPAAVGIAFLSITYSKLMFYYPLPFTKLGLESDDFHDVGTEHRRGFKIEGIPNFGKMEMILGKFPGPMGATNILVVATCAIITLSTGKCELAYSGDNARYNGSLCISVSTCHVQSNRLCFL